MTTQTLNTNPNPFSTENQLLATTTVRQANTETSTTPQSDTGALERFSTYCASFVPDVNNIDTSNDSFTTTLGRLGGKVTAATLGGVTGLFRGAYQGLFDGIKSGSTKGQEAAKIILTTAAALASCQIATYRTDPPELDATHVSAALIGATVSHFFLGSITEKVGGILGATFGSVSQIVVGSLKGAYNGASSAAPYGEYAGQALFKTHLGATLSSLGVAYTALQLHYYSIFFMPLVNAGISTGSWTTHQVINAIAYAISQNETNMTTEIQILN